MVELSSRRSGSVHRRPSGVNDHGPEATGTGLRLPRPDVADMINGEMSWVTGLRRQRGLPVADVPSLAVSALPRESVGMLGQPRRDRTCGSLLHSCSSAAKSKESRHFAVGEDVFADAAFLLHAETCAKLATHQSVIPMTADTFGVFGSPCYLRSLKVASRSISAAWRRC
jgi:hypothetical protein